MPADHSFKVLECNHYDSYVVERLSVQTVFQDAFNAKPAELVHANWLCISVVVVRHLVGSGNLGRITAQPDTLAYVIVAKFIKDAITAQNNEVVVLGDLKNFNLWLRIHDVRITAPVLQLCFRITECPAN